MIYQNGPLSFEQADEILEQAVSELPQKIFTHLNGGIILVPDTVISPHSKGGGLYILGCYNYEPYGLGRYIKINYGSFLKVHGFKSVPEQEKLLRDVLHHELIHHLESMAGVYDLEVQDRIFIEQYKKNHGG